MGFEIETEIAKTARAVERKGNGPIVPVDEQKQGVAEEHARFMEMHGDDAVREAEALRDAAYAYAKEIRERTADHIAKIKAFTDSIKASQAEMAEVRMRFLSSGTRGNNESSSAGNGDPAIGS
ncbi:MAG: hypothetical protein C5B54_04750 [Acidobacteria bacterium]|nr:MAG: hypothetical protein C5B54_04750 [Acidobacteriota bacterium]